MGLSTANFPWQQRRLTWSLKSCWCCPKIEATEISISHASCHWFKREKNIKNKDMKKTKTLKNIQNRRPEVFLRKSVLKICSKFKGEHPCWNVISIKLQRNVIETTLRHGCSSVNLLHIFRTTFLKNTSGLLLLKIYQHLVYKYT